MMRSSKGFTLVELTVATAVAGILIVVIMTFFVNGIVNYSVSSARGDLLREAQITLDNITQDVRSSSNALVDPTQLDDHEPSGGWTGDGNTLILSTAAMDSERNIIFADELHYISEKNNYVYFVENGTLYRRTLAIDIESNAASTTCPASVGDSCANDSVLANNVTGFDVQYFNGEGAEVTPDQARSVEVTLNLEASKWGREVDASYTTRTVFRNE